MPTPSCERALPSVQSLGRERAARRQGGRQAGLAGWGLSGGHAGSWNERDGGHFCIPCRSPEGKAKRRTRGIQGFGSASVLPPGASSCPCVLPHGAGLCRRPPLPTGGGAAGPDAVSPLFLQLPGPEGAVGGHPAGVRVLP